MYVGRSLYTIYDDIYYANAVYMVRMYIYLIFFNETFFILELTTFDFFNFTVRTVFQNGG